jgi:predicted ArsR family transcriptional regulator
MQDPDPGTRATGEVSRLPVELDREEFFGNLLEQLAGSLEDVIGIDEASGFISLVGQNIGEQIDRAYRRELGVERLTRPLVGRVLVDLKHRIQGDFHLIEESDDRIVLGNRACPFGKRVRSHPSLCMMTSNVFGVIAAENLGYARVELERTIARGDPGCRVVVHLRDEGDPGERRGREYFRSEE